MDDVPLFDLPLTIQENVQQQILEGEENWKYSALLYFSTVHILPAKEKLFV